MDKCIISPASSTDRQLFVDDLIISPASSTDWQLFVDNCIISPASSTDRQLFVDDLSISLASSTDWQLFVDNTQSVYQGLAAQMSLEEARCVQRILNIRSGQAILCADVGVPAEMCASEMPPKAYIDGRLRRCQVKDRDVRRES